MALPLVDFSQLLILFVVLIISLTVHQAAQAWLADVLGDPTAADAGRLSFNPGLHVDPVGSIMFPLLSFVSGFAFVGWGRSLPVDVQQFGAEWRWKLLATGTIGPACSLALAGAAAVAIRAGVAATHSPFDAIIAPLLFRAVDVNVVLAALNLLPVPPLDGSAMLAAVLPPSWGIRLRRHRRVGVVMLFALLLTGALGIVLGPVRASLVSALL